MTPRGWERGSNAIDFSPVHPRDPPADRVLTTAYNEYQGSVFSGISKTVSVRWTSGDDRRIAELKAKFGDPPIELWAGDQHGSGSEVH